MVLKCHVEGASANTDVLADVVYIMMIRRLVGLQDRHRLCRLSGVSMVLKHHNASAVS